MWYFLRFVLPGIAASIIVGLCVSESIGLDSSDDCVPASQVSTLQKPAALRELYQVEQQSWLEYIARFQTYQLDSSYDVLFYHLALDIAVDSQYIIGDLRCRFRVDENGLSTIVFNLQQSLIVDSIVGCAGSFQHVYDSLFIDLDRSYDAGELADIRIFYQGTPALAGGLKGMNYASHGAGEPVIVTLSTPFLAHYWWPCKDGPGDKPDSVYVDLTIPDRVVNGHALIAVSNGTLFNTVSADGKKTFQWRERYPIVTYYVMAAVSNYASLPDQFNGQSGESFPLEYYVFAEDSADGWAGVVDLPAVIAFYSEMFGAYPFRDEKYGMTQIGFYGGIENQTNTIQGEFSPGWFATSIHELAHQWFGDMITCRDWHHGWLNEGFATYCEALWREHTEGVAGYRSEMRTNEYYSGGTLYLQDVTDPFQVFIDIIYLKGAYVLHMLRGVLGDEVFFDCIRAYATSPQLMYDHATTEDFRSVCEDVSGRELGFFFDQWIYDEYYPRYNFGYIQDPLTHRIDGLITQTQGQFGFRPLFEMPVQIQFDLSGGGDTVITIWNNQVEQSFTFDAPGLVDAIHFDPDKWILKDADQFNGFNIALVDFAVDDSPGDGNGRPDPGESNLRLELTLANLGVKIEDLVLQVSTGHPAIVFADDESFLGSIDYGAEADNTSDPIVFAVDPSFPPTIVDFQLTFTSPHVGDTIIDTIAIAVGPPQVIIVDGDGSMEFSYDQYYRDMLYSIRMPYVVWDTELSSSPPADTLDDYPVVIWYTGDHRTDILTAEEVASMKSYLDQGGRLVLTGQDIAEDLSDDADSTFLVQYLGARYSPGAPLILAEGIPGDPIGDGHMVALGGPGGAANQNSPDILVPADASTRPIYTYYGSSDVAGVHVVLDDYRVVFLGFGLEGVADGLGYTTRAEIFERMYAWLKGTGPDYLPGDPNIDWAINPVDIVCMVNYVYLGSSPPPLRNAMDVNADCVINPADIVVMVNYVYRVCGEILPGCVE